MEKDLKTTLEELNETIQKGMKYHEEFLVFYEQQKQIMEKVKNNLILIS